MINSCNTRCLSRDPRKRVWVSWPQSFLFFTPAKRVVNPVAQQVVVPPVKWRPQFSKFCHKSSDCHIKMTLGNIFHDFSKPIGHVAGGTPETALRSGGLTVRVGTPEPFPSV